MENSIVSNDKVSALPPPPAGRGRSVNKKAKTPAAAETGIKIEADTYTPANADRTVQDAPYEQTAMPEAGRDVITAEEIRAFVEAYNRLPDLTGDDFDAVRAEVYKPVPLNRQGRQISLYEIGVAHSPNNWQKGSLSVNDATLVSALEKRGGDVHALFLQEGAGLLGRLCALVLDKESAASFLRVCKQIMKNRRNYD